MRWGIVVGLTIIYIASVIFAGLAAMQSGIFDADEVAKLDNLMHPEIADWISNIPVINVIATFAWGIWNFLLLFISLLGFGMMDIFAGSFSIFGLVIWSPLIIGALVMFVSWLRGTSSS